MKTGILLAALGGVDAAWHTPSWSDRKVASGTGSYAATLCPEDGYRGRNWKIELHTWKKHGDVCRATDGSTYWEIPAGCEYHKYQRRIWTRKKGSTGHSPCRVDHTQMMKAKVVGKQWTDDAGANILCPKDGTYGYNWKVEWHTSSRHGDVCRATDGSGHWQPPSGCGKNVNARIGGCTTHACEAGEINKICRVPGRPNPTVCPATGYDGHIWQIEDHGNNPNMGTLCRGQNGHWFPPVNCVRAPRNKGYAVFYKDTAEGKKGTPCRVPKNIFEANVGIDLHVCENDTFKAECPAGSVIKIQGASYGRKIDGSVATAKNPNWRHKKSQICEGKPVLATGKACHVEDSKAIVAAKCDGKTECEIEAVNSVFRQDPCTGTSKLLTVHYECDAVPMAKCDVSDCANWTCDQWCMCFDPEMETDGVYARNNCAEDDGNTCACNGELQV